MEDQTLSHLPKHLAIIMDGNGRWAKARNLPVSEGHRRGADVLRKIIEAVGNRGIKYLTVYAFSTENWRRSSLEVNAVMQLMRFHLEKSLADLVKNNVKLKTIGDLSRLPKDLIKSLKDAAEKTKENTGLTLIVALNYGGRQEIVSACRQLIEKVSAGDISANEINEEIFEKYLDTTDIPDPDFLLRPGGEKRLSNYLLWQMAYTEFLFTDTLWPDFTETDLDDALSFFAKRNRRYGGRAA